MCGITLLLKIMMSLNVNYATENIPRKDKVQQFKNHLKSKHKLQYDEMVINDTVKATEKKTKGESVKTPLEQMKREK